MYVFISSVYESQSWQKFLAWFWSKFYINKWPDQVDLNLSKHCHIWYFDYIIVNTTELINVFFISLVSYLIKKEGYLFFLDNLVMSLLIACSYSQCNSFIYCRKMCWNIYTLARGWNKNIIKQRQTLNCYWWWIFIDQVKIIFLVQLNFIKVRLSLGTRSKY